MDDQKHINDQFIPLRKHRGRKSKAELLQIAIQSGSLPSSTIPITPKKKKQCSNSSTTTTTTTNTNVHNRQQINEVSATTSGFDVDRAAIYNSLLPKEIIDEDKWRWSTLCRKIMNISDAICAIARNLNENRISADGQRDIVKMLYTVSEDTKRLADSAEWIQVQLISGVSATIHNPEILGHGSLTQSVSHKSDDTNNIIPKSNISTNECNNDNSIIDIIM